jgi:hypothetical protein
MPGRRGQVRFSIAKTVGSVALRRAQCSIQFKLSLCVHISHPPLFPLTHLAGLCRVRSRELDTVVWLITGTSTTKLRGVRSVEGGRTTPRMTHRDPRTSTVDMQISDIPFLGTSSQSIAVNIQTSHIVQTNKVRLRAYRTLVRVIYDVGRSNFRQHKAKNTSQKSR